MMAANAERIQPKSVDNRSDLGMQEGWAFPKISDILEVNYGKGLKKAKRMSGPIPVYGSNGIVGAHNEAFTQGPTIIIGRKGTVGAVGFSDVPCWPIDTTYFIDKFNGLDPKYIVYALKGLNLAELDTSTAIPGLNRNDLYGQRIPLAPLSEQKRIVAKVEQLLARVNVVRERLAKVQQILKRFRQSVLTAACSGRLTADWRTKHCRNATAHEMVKTLMLMRQERLQENGIRGYKSPLKPDTSQLNDLPPEWAVASMDQVTCLITSGSRGWAKFYSRSGPLFIRAQNINTDALRFEGVAHVQPPQNAEGQRTQIRFGDLLITVTGANVTKSALVDTEIDEAYVSQHVALVRPVDISLRHFIYFWTISPFHGRAKLIRDAYGAGKPGLNLKNIREITMALPPLAEQEEIVHRVETLFKLAEAIEKRVTPATAHAEKLNHAILSKAFRGELVPTEAELARQEGRSYESASVLFSRIKALGKDL